MLTTSSSLLLAKKARAASQTPAEMMAAGERLRESVPLKAHGVWSLPTARPDPIAMLRETDSDRLVELIPVRYGRMLASPFAFYRGAANVMAADLAATPATGVRIQICGDCHLENFGGFATPERNMIFDINDFDETLPGPWEWDIKRLAASFVLAARAHGMSYENGREAATACTRFYRERLTAYARMHPLDVWYARIGTEDFLGLLDHPGLKAMIRSRITKAAKRDARSPNYPAVVVG